MDMAAQRGGSILSAGAGPTMRAGTRRVINGAAITAFASGTNAVAWWGIFFLIVIELTVFSTLISSYFYLRAAVADWPPDGISPPSLLLPTANSLFFIASVIPIALSVRRIKQGNQRGLLIYLAVAFVMGAIFLALKYVEYSDSPYLWTTNAYGSIVWTMVGFHSAHVFATLLKIAAIAVAAWQGTFDEVRHAAVEGNALYWYFVVGIWVPLYFVIYWAPRWL
jgi:cytochrome c oxidase subunit III